jgi:hypothetical protein
MTNGKNKKISLQWRYTLNINIKYLNAYMRLYANYKNLVTYTLSNNDI